MPSPVAILTLVVAAAGVSVAPSPQVSGSDERFDVPTVVWAERAPPGAVTPRELGVTAEESARAQLARFAPLYRASAGQMARAERARLHDTGAGAIVVSFGARVGGVPVFREALHVVLDRGLRPVALTGFLSPVALSAGAAPPFLLDPTEALARAFAAAGGQPASSWTDAGAATGEYRRYALDTGAAGARVRRVLFATPERLEPGYHVELTLPSAALAFVVNARDGRILFRHLLTDDAAFGYRVWADPLTLVPFDGPQGTEASPHPTGVPDGYQAPFVAPLMVSVQSGPIANGDPWLADGATQTAGNNVDAYADLAAPNGFGSGDLRASTTAPGVFDRVYDTALAPGASATQTQASVTQLFYTLNFLHDWYYDAGFDEAAGNAQAQNFGRGGIEGDRLLAEAQDYDGRTNANMTTLADGASPRLQAFIFEAIYQHRVRVGAPAAIAGDLPAGVADFGPATFNVTGQVVLVNGGNPPGSDGCETPFANAFALAGKIALLDRGTCTFVEKVGNAQAAGAIAAIVGNNTSGAAPPMPGSAPSVTIPSLSLSQTDATKLKGQLAAGVSATLERAAALDRDGALDNGVIAHEWGHYLSDRLVGDANGLSNKMGRGLGEGWSDFQTLLMFARAADAQLPSNAGFGGVYTIAGYVHSGADNDGYYYSLRRLPYSTDFAKNALTFKHLSDGEPLPLGVPTAGGQDGASNSEVHNAGEVWATMLWECYVALLRDSSRLSFAQSQERMRRYLVASLKATPVSPTLLEARDALLAVVYASDPADHRLFAQAFARRGAGLRALAPPRDSPTHTPLQEDFTAGSDLEVVEAQLSDAVSPCDDDGVLDNTEVGQLTLTIRNVGLGPLEATAATVTSATPGIRFPRGGALKFAPTQPFGTATATTEVTLDEATDIAALELTFSVTDPALTFPGPVTFATTFRGNSDDQASASAADDVEARLSPWSPGHDASLPNATDWKRREVSAFDHRWASPLMSKRGDAYLVSPELQTSATGSFGFTFRHRYELEARSSPLTLLDAAVLEISEDAGQTWTDIGGFASPGYDATVLAGGNNPLKGRQAFGFRSPGYPALVTTTVDLGSAYQGKSVRVRFRVASDEAVPSTGWEIDDLAFTGIEGTPFPILVADPGGICGDRPVARDDRDLSASGGCGCGLTGATGWPLLALALVEFARKRRARAGLSWR